MSNPALPDQSLIAGNTQSERDAAETIGMNWLSSNEGDLGYRYSSLNSINTHTVKVVRKASLGFNG